MFSTPEEIARLAVENDVHVVGASSLAAGHKTLIPELVEALKKMGTRRYLRSRRWRHSTAGLRLPARARRGGDLWSGTPMLDSVRGVLNLISQHHD